MAGDERYKVHDVQEAIELAQQFKSAGRYDWFRGQVEDWPPHSSAYRRWLYGGQEVLAKVAWRQQQFLDWAANTEGLEALVADEDSLYAVMQHYGIPTDYIDFTTDASIAGFFAADTASPKPGSLSCGCDLRLMSSLNDVSGIPTEGKNLIIVAAVNNVLHFRIFDGVGKVVVDTDQTGLTEQARQIEDLRMQLESLWPPQELTRSESGRVITAVTSIVGRTLSCIYCLNTDDLMQYWRVAQGYLNKQHGPGLQLRP
jgi:hypothetical protein